MKTAELTNIGPVEHVKIPVPDKGGVVVLRGANGSGKTIVLQTLDTALTRGKNKVPIRDGQMEGTFNGFGVAVRIGKSKQIRGEAEVHFLGDGESSISQLIDPGLKEPDKADAKRIEALARIHGAKADPSLFYALVGGQAEFDRIVAKSSTDTADLVQMAKWIKADFEQASRTEAGAAENATAREDACRKSAEGVSLYAESDAETLQDALEEAITDKERLATEAKAIDESLARRMDAETQLAKAKSGYTGKSIEEAGATFEEARERSSKSVEAFRLAQEQYNAAKKEMELAAGNLHHAKDILKAAEEHKSIVDSWEKTLSGPRPEPIAPERIQAAEAKLASARQAHENGVAIRKARQSLEEAKSFAKLASKHNAKAVEFRDAAHKVHDVLSKVVSKSGCPLKIEPVNFAMRLTLPTERGPSTCYGELSDGERAIIALEIWISAVGPGGEITLRQSIYEGLDPENRMRFAQKAEAGGVIVYTAEAAAGPLRAELASIV